MSCFYICARTVPWNVLQEVSKTLLGERGQPFRTKLPARRCIFRPLPPHFSEKLLQESMLTFTIARRRRWRVSFIFYVLICIIYSTKIVHTSRPESWWRVLWARHISKHNFVVMERERGWSEKGKHIECYKKVWWFYAIHQLFRSLTLSTTLHT